MGRIYVKNFGENVAERDLAKFFGVEKAEILTKKDSEEKIISRFCYLTVNDEQRLDQVS